jgi:hypothetical protein
MTNDQNEIRHGATRPSPLEQFGSALRMRIDSRANGGPSAAMF